MSNILQIGYTAEGTTDQRFLSNIIRKTFEYAVYDCHSEIEVYEPEFLAKQGENFVSQIEKIVKEYSYFHVICIHCDSDSPTIDDVFRNKITPALYLYLLVWPSPVLPSGEENCPACSAPRVAGSAVCEYCGHQFAK